MAQITLHRITSLWDKEAQVLGLANAVLRVSELWKHGPRRFQPSFKNEWGQEDKGEKIEDEQEFASFVEEKRQQVKKGIECAKQDLFKIFSSASAIMSEPLNTREKEAAATLLRSLQFTQTVIREAERAAASAGITDGLDDRKTL